MTVETISQVIPISGFKYFFDYIKVASTIILGVGD
jgi:hypothetical protein